MKNFYLLATLLFGVQALSINAQAAVLEPAAGSEWTEPKTGMKFVWAPSGCFQMGGNGEAFEKPIHKVCVQGVWVGRYEVTQKQYQQIMGENLSKFQGENNPMDFVSWQDAANFTNKMSSAANTKVRLLSEAEWEYACRAGGAHEAYCGNGAVDKLGWYSGNSDKTTHPVGQLNANAWGLHDMSGNVFEWTEDCQNNSYKGAPADGSAWVAGNCVMRVGRGGAWNNNPDVLSASHRKFDDAGGPDSTNGFRVVRVDE